MSTESGFDEAPPERTANRSDAAESAIRQVANSLHRLNEAVTRAVDAGLSVELLRTARYHNAAGNWGDQLTPIIRQKD